MFSSCQWNFVSPGLPESADNFWVAWFGEKIVETGVGVQNVAGIKFVRELFAAVLQWFNVIQNHRRPAVDLRVDYSHCSSLKRLERLRLGIRQARVPYWTGVFEDRPHYCLVETQLVLSRCPGARELLQEVQSGCNLGVDRVNVNYCALLVIQALSQAFGA